MTILSTYRVFYPSNLKIIQDTNQFIDRSIFNVSNHLLTAILAVACLSSKNGTTQIFVLRCALEVKLYFMQIKIIINYIYIN